MSYVYTFINDRRAVEFLQEIKEGKKAQNELLIRLRDSRRLKGALDYLDRVGAEIGTDLGFYEPVKVRVRLKFFKDSFSQCNGKNIKSYEKYPYIEIIHIDMASGTAMIRVKKEEVLKNG